MIRNQNLENPAEHRRKLLLTCYKFMVKEIREGALRNDNHPVTDPWYSNPPSSDAALKIRRKVRHLGQYVADYKVFRKIAAEDRWGSFKDLEVEYLEKPAAPNTRYDTRIVKNGLNSVEWRNIKAPNANERLKRFLRDGRCHAEIQILYHLEHQLSKEEVPHLYIGCSKRACYMCQHFLSNYKSESDPTRAYGRRGGHGVVYPDWHLGNLGGKNMTNSTRKSMNMMHKAMLKALREPRRQFPQVGQTPSGTPPTATFKRIAVDSDESSGMSETSPRPWTSSLSSTLSADTPSSTPSNSPGKSIETFDLESSSIDMED
ncbi:hypothetical protein BCR34DRAFT_564216 [Clohesyomyces aquaticus]|uniref:Uncharacterized protein n=1 Tax=Clohesyomyces aquaticus TaxID=1231657 RepID=A0A1Y1ZPE4_9PLEO|nr:hypothetical protein BCR34DRAFT_564216 [Clohesyomyces aquaticus]